MNKIKLFKNVEKKIVYEIVNQTVRRVTTGFCHFYFKTIFIFASCIVL